MIAGLRRDQHVHQQSAEKERRKVVHLEHAVEPINGDAIGGEDTSGVVGQHVDSRITPPQLLGQGTHLGEVREIRTEVVGSEFVGDRLRLGYRATDDNDVVAGGRQPPGRCCADAVARPSDDDRPLRHVRRTPRPPPLLQQLLVSHTGCAYSKLRPDRVGNRSYRTERHDL